jgi:CRISPR-associated endonuclease Cas1
MTATKTVAQPTRVRKSAQQQHQSLTVHFKRLFAPAHGVLLLDGYGIKLHAENGHLVIEDGIGDDRRRNRFPRVQHGLRRIVVIGSDGFVSLAAIRWMADQKVSFSMLERTGDLLLSTGPVSSSDARMRRAQAMSKESPLALAVGRELIRQKLTGQERVLRDGLAQEAAADAVAMLRDSLVHLTTVDEIILCEGHAAAIYWTAWRDVQAQFPKQQAGLVPEHWLTFGIRRSLLTSSPRKATNPINALLNYLYALLESETLIAIRALGLDPGLGILHIDDSNRDSLVYDLMEPIRPKVDAYVLSWMQRTALRRSFFFEERDGNCRLMSDLCRQLGDTIPIWAREVAPIVEWLAQSIWQTLPHYANAWAPGTRLTQRRRREAAGMPIPDVGKAPVMETVCQNCGKAVSRRRKLCRECNEQEMRDRWKAVQDRQRGQEMTAEAKQKSSMRMKDHRAALRNWDPSQQPPWLTEEFYKAKIQPALMNVSTRELAAAIGVRRSYISGMKRGEDIAHPRFWLKLTEILGVQAG